MSKIVKTISKILVIALVINFIFTPSEVFAQSQKDAALKAYAEVLSKNTIAWGNSIAYLQKYDGSGLKAGSYGSDFGLAYVNNDDIPELLVSPDYNSHAQGYLALYTYKNGKVVEIDNMMDEFEYYPKKNMVIAIHRGMDGYQRYYRIISGTKSKDYLNKCSEKESGWDVNRDGKIKGAYYGKAKSSKSWRYKKITKTKFNKLLKKRVGKTKAVKPTYYRNTAANRKRILGY